MYLFSRAALTKYHKLNGLNQQKFMISQFWRLSPKSSVSGDMLFLEALGEKFHLISSSFLGISWLISALL